MGEKKLKPVVDLNVIEHFRDRVKNARKKRMQSASYDLFEDVLYCCKYYRIRYPHLEPEDFINLLYDPESKAHLLFHLENPGLPIDEMVDE